MKESKEQIVKHLNKYYAKDIERIYELITDYLLLNPDFIYAGDGEEDDVRPVLEELTGRRPSFAFDEILSSEDMAVIGEIVSLEDEKRIKKAVRIEILSKVLSSDALFEGFCLMIQDPAMVMAELSDLFCCTGRWEALSQDAVFRKRMEYKNRMRSYVKAAANLYGCIHIEDLLEVIWKYEPAWGQKSGRRAAAGDYIRSEGAYKYTILFSPEWLCLITIREFAQDCVTETGMTFGGLIVHDCFREDLEKEQKLMLDHIEDLGYLPEYDELADFLENGTKNVSYRRLLKAALGKELYIPGSKKAFLDFEEEPYPDTPAQNKLKNFLEKNYFGTFEKYGADHGLTGGQALERFMLMEADLTGNGVDCADQDPMDSIHEFSDIVNEYGIVFDSEADVNRMVGYLMEIMNSTRLWVNRGYTPDELRRLHPAKPGRKPTIIPGSSQAAQMMAEGRNEIEQMGFRLDLDSNADEIPVFSMPKGAGGPVQKKVKKIYPNDPCPCGSGKKYKKCCGRR